jgi:hypothetical protein
VASLPSQADVRTAVELVEALSPRIAGVAAVAQELRHHPLATALTLWRQRSPLARRVALRLGLLSDSQTDALKASDA